MCVKCPIEIQKLNRTLKLNFVQVQLKYFIDNIENGTCINFCLIIFKKLCLNPIKSQLWFNFSGTFVCFFTRCTCYCSTWIWYYPADFNNNPLLSAHINVRRKIINSLSLTTANLKPIAIIQVCYRHCPSFVTVFCFTLPSIISRHVTYRGECTTFHQIRKTSSNSITVISNLK